MPSANTIVTRALRSLGVIDASDTPSAEDMAAGFEALNEMIDGWATQRWTIFVVTRTVYALTASQAAYTIGSGGNFDQQRPLWIEGVSVIEDNTAAMPLEIPCGPPLLLAQFQRIAQKSATSTFPYAIYYDHAWAAGLGTITVYPVPTSSLAALVLYTPTALSQFADLTTVYTFPPGYGLAIRLNLAKVLAPEFGRQLRPDLKADADDALAWVKRANYQPTEAQFDPRLAPIWGSGYDIRTDTGGGG